MADVPLNRDRIVPVMAGRKCSTRAKSEATPAPQPVPRRATRSQSKLLGLDNVDVNLKTLADRGLYAHETKGDGNCLYYALSDQMYGDFDHATEIRDNLAGHMQAHREYFAPFAIVGGGERRSKRAVPRKFKPPITIPSPTPTEMEDAFQELITRTATDFIWGGAEEIQACCQYYRRDIKVYSEEHVQDFRAWDAPDQEPRETLHLAYANSVHYSSVRNVDGPHEGLPCVSPQEPPPSETASKNSFIVDLDTASPWKISCIQEGLGGQYDYDTIVEMLRRCRGDIDRAFANLLDEESSTSSFTSSSASATSSQSSVTTLASAMKEERQIPNALQVAFKPHLASSRSSSRHSTASKRSADDSDEEFLPNIGKRQRGREQKRRILPKVTVGINIGDQEKPDLVSLRLRVSSETEAEQASPSPTPVTAPASISETQPETTQQLLEGRKLRPRKPKKPTSTSRITRSTSTESSIEPSPQPEVKQEEPSDT
ncbi:hypothetical protein BGW36DRAFT_367670 [Talaromyces proteolyticus]|uniref:OTU domain-containing protein n=1 Tax=Talaromyces proteolyticus TaxID=1131652 RepID=A0AAD4Q6A3_9EURO|nr:uncharacterized protein BGW36DRAFT_367670 [Talaromyces proteolyticus]KAH8705491.1 hypothetical protein BGW36DRAFT_367670 [Talaromyces proteolyticus]